MPPDSVEAFVAGVCDRLQGRLNHNIVGGFYDPRGRRYTGITFLQVGRTVLKVLHAENPAVAFSFCATTLMMNYIASDHICIAYPFYTFRKIGMMFSCWRPNYLEVMRYPQDVVKYLQRGFAIYTLPFRSPIVAGQKDVYQQPYTAADFGNWGKSSCQIRDVCPKQERVFGDRFCALIPLSGRRLSLLSNTMAWQLGGIGCGRSV